MAITYSDYTGDGSNTDFAFSFPYLEDTHVVVEVDGVDKTTTAGDFTLPTTSLVRMTVAPALAALVRVKRVSDFATDLVDFTNGSVLTEGDLDRAYQHNRYLNEEAAEGNDASLQIVGGGTDYNAANKKIVNLSDPTLTTDAANKDYIDTQISKQVTGSSTASAKYTFTGAGSAVFTFSPTITLGDDTMYEVAIDGVLQEPTVAYAIDADANTITFTSIPPTSSNIVVIQRGYTVPVTGGLPAGSVDFNTLARVLDATTATNPAQQYVEIRRGAAHSGVGYSWPWAFDTTRAGFVCQVHDSVAATSTPMPQAVFDFEQTGDATTLVTPGTETSTAISWGLQVSSRKYNDGSGACISAIAGLYNIGGTGYNETGLYMGEATNNGSTLGTLSGVEVIIKDGMVASGTALTNASNTSPIIITAATHGLVTGRAVTISGVSGNTAANGNFIVTRLSDDTFSLDGSTGNAPYVSGGAWIERFDTKMNGVIGRVVKNHPSLVSTGTTSRTSNSFLATSEGSNYIHSAFSAGLSLGGVASANKFEYGIRLDSADILTGVSLALPNNTNIAFGNAAGTLKPIFYVDSSDQTVTQLANDGGTTSSFRWKKADGTDLMALEAHTDATNPTYLFVGGALHKVEEGAADSGGAGYKVLRVAN